LVPTFSTMAFTLQTAQTSQLEERLAEIRADGAVFEVNHTPVAPSASESDRASDLLNYNFDIGAVTIGADYRLTHDLAIGLCTGYGHTGAHYQYESRVDNDVGKWEIYGTWHHGGFYINGIVGGGYNSYTMNRQIAFLGLNRKAHSEPEAWEFDTVGTLGYDWKLGNLTAGVFGTLQYVNLDVQSFQESGAGSLNLRISRSASSQPTVTWRW